MPPKPEVLSDYLLKNYPGTQKDKLQKEDKRDSRKIAYALRSGNLTPIYTPSESALNDRSLVRSRKTLVNDMIRFKNRSKGLLHITIL